jgi:tetratricopeptide (TPR) repeat protein
MVFVADDLTAWLVGMLADAGQKKLTTVLLGTEQERALRSAVTAAVRLTAGELCPGDDEQAEHVALVISQVFNMPVPEIPPGAPATLVQTLHAGIAGQLAVLDDAGLTGTGQSSADIIGVTGAVLAEKLTSHMLQEIVVRGASSGPLSPLASQLNHDVTHLQGKRIEGAIGQLADKLQETLARIDDPHALRFLSGRERSAHSVDARPGLNNLPMRTDLFVGRAHELDRLDSALDTSGGAVVQALHGLGGIGKSTLAAHWAATRGHSYYPIRWIVADTTADIEQGLADLASELESSLAELPTGAQAKWGLQWLATHRDWLLILDNVSRVADVAPVLARASGGRFLITSRTATGWRGMATLPLDVLTETEAIDLFTQIIFSKQQRDLEGVAELCAEVGYLPLAIEQAAAYLEQNPLTTPRVYLDLVRQFPAVMYRQSGEQFDDNRTIARIWRITLDRIVAEQPLAADLLRALAWYSFDAIPDSIPYAILDGTADLPEINAALGLLVAYNMITADPSFRTYLVHRLVQSFLRTPDIDDPHRAPELIGRARHLAMHLHSALPEGNDLSTWQAWDRLIPHVDRLFDNAIPDSYDVATVLHSVGIHLLERGQPRRALTYLERALAGVNRLFGEGQPIPLTYCHNLACAFVDAGDPGHAVLLLKQTLERRELLLGADHPETRITRDSLACAYSEAGELNLAIPMLEEILKCRELELGENHWGTAEARHNLACAYRDFGDLDRAIRLLERVVATADEGPNENLPRVLTYRHNLANAILSTGDSDRAIPMLEQSLEAAVQLYGHDNHSTALTKNSLAGAYADTGDLERAIHLYEQALETALRVLGEDHPHTQTIRSNLSATEPH